MKQKVMDFGAILTDPLALLEGIHNEAYERLLSYGFPPELAQQLGGWARIYFGKTAFQRKRRKVIAAINEQGLSLNRLWMMEEKVAELTSVRDQWQARLKILGVEEPAKRTRHSFRTFTRLVRAIIKNLKPARSGPATRMSVIHRGEGQNWSLILHGEAANIDALATLIGKKTPDPSSRALELLSEGGERITRVLRPIVVIPLDEATKVLDATGDETVFQCTDGITRTSTQLAAETLDPEWGFALIHPVKGPVDLLRSSRFANDKQRTLAMVENPVCPWDGCRIPAQDCEFHHMRSWAQGGETNSENLTTCCAFHNGRNDDDPAARPVNGHLERGAAGVRRVFGTRG